MKGYVQVKSSGRYWNPDTKPGTTSSVLDAGIFDRRDCRVVRAVEETKGCTFIPIEKENKTMNYTDAVRELVNNPKAEAITFPSSNDPRGFRRIELETRRLPVGTYTNLIFPATETKRRQNVVATSPDFLLREDFTVVYKEERKYTAIELGTVVHEAFEAGIEVGYLRGCDESYMKANDVAFAKFKKQMEVMLNKGQKA